MCERLREIAESFALRPGLFGVKPEMIGITQHAFKQQPGFVQAVRDRRDPRASELRPARTEHMLKVPSSPGKPVDAAVRRITIDQAVAHQAAIVADFQGWRRSC